MSKEAGHRYCVVRLTNFVNTSNDDTFFRLVIWIGRAVLTQLNLACIFWCSCLLNRHHSVPLLH
jgi:hypothetical protein